MQAFVNHLNQLNIALGDEKDRWEFFEFCKSRNLKARVEDVLREKMEEELEELQAKWDETTGVEDVLREKEQQIEELRAKWDKATKVAQDTEDTDEYQTQQCYETMKLAKQMWQESSELGQKVQKLQAEINELKLQAEMRQMIRKHQEIDDLKTFLDD